MLLAVSDRYLGDASHRLCGIPEEILSSTTEMVICLMSRMDEVIYEEVVSYQKDGKSPLARMAVPI